MSYGDEIIASGHAFSVYQKTGKTVRITDKDGKPRWADVWNDLSWISKTGEQALQNGPHCRPYVRYPFTRAGGCTYSGWKVRDHIGFLSLTARERAVVPPQPYVLVEPHVPEASNPNKQWGWDNWQRLVKMIPHPVVQVGPAGTKQLEGVRFVETPTFRMGAAVLDAALFSILPEGGLHHAAGALRRPAIVLFGGAVDADAMGYPFHTNIVRPPACGKWLPCDHCAAIWASITPGDIACQLPSF